MTNHTLSLGPLSLLATQTGPLLTITIHAPSDSAPVGKMTLTVPEWTALVALVDCMGAADKRASEDAAEIQAMRESLIHACELRSATHEHERQLWAIRQAANHKAKRFSHDWVQEKYEAFDTWQSVDSLRQQLAAAQREVEMLRRATTRIVDVSDPEQCDHNRQIDPDTGECLDCGTVLP